MNILVTGSSGYIGRHFINNFQHIHKISTFSLHNNTIENINFKNIDTILHCAALVHQKHKHTYNKYYEINVTYPVALAKKAKTDGIKHFIFISTVGVYGGNNQYINDSTRCNPLSDYAKTKLETENKLLNIEDKNFAVSIIRSPMVYGKDAPGNIATLVNLIQKIPILPFAKIKNKRSFVYIGNLIYLIAQVLEQKQSGIFLASDDRPLSTTELIEQIANAFNKKIYLIKIPFFDLLLKQVKPSLYKRLYESLEINNNKTKKILHIKNPYTPEEGIAYMIKGDSI